MVVQRGYGDVGHGESWEENNVRYQRRRRVGKNIMYRKQGGYELGNELKKESVRSRNSAAWGDIWGRKSFGVGASGSAARERS